MPVLAGGAGGASAWVVMAIVPCMQPFVMERDTTVNQAAAKVLPRATASRGPGALAAAVQDFRTPSRRDTELQEHSDDSFSHAALAEQVLEQVMGRKPYFVRIGGTIPAAALIKSILGIDITMFAFGWA